MSSQKLRTDGGMGSASSGSSSIWGPATNREPTRFRALGWGGFEDSHGTAPPSG